MTGRAPATTLQATGSADRVTATPCRIVSTEIIHHETSPSTDQRASSSASPHSRPRSARSPSRRRSAPAPLPRHPRQSDRLHLRRRPLHRRRPTGGVARRLTSDDGFEMFARFSPDGKSLAFTGQYDGNTEVYVMPAEGGVPKRLTYTATLGRDDVSDRMGPNNIVMGWKNDDSTILFRSRMHRVERLHRPALPRLASTAGCSSSCRCRAAASARSRPTASSSPTTASSASSAPGSATAAAWPTTSGSTTSRRRPRPNLTNNPALGHHPDVEREQDLLPLRPRRARAG